MQSALIRFVKNVEKFFSDTQFLTSLLRTTFFEHVKPLIRRAENQPEGAGVLDQIYEYNKDYCLEDGLSAIELWRA